MGRKKTRVEPPKKRGRKSNAEKAAELAAAKKKEKRKAGKPVKKKKGRGGRPAREKLPDALAGKFCIAREHLDGHIETWSDSERFERLDKSLPKFFESKDEAVSYIDQFKEVTQDFSDDSLIPVAVVPLVRFLTHHYTVTINEAGKPEIEISVVVKGQGNSWKEAVEIGKRSLIERYTKEFSALNAFLKERDADQRIIEDLVADAKAAIFDYDSEVNKFR